MKSYLILIVLAFALNSLQAQEGDIIQMDEQESTKKTVKDAVDKAVKEVEDQTTDEVGKVKVKVEVEDSGKMDVKVDFKEPVDAAVQESVEKSVEDAVNVAVDDTVKEIAARTEATPKWKFTAGYGVGFADYTEDGNILDVNSGWSGWNSELNFRAQTSVWKIFPYYRLRLLNTETAVEEWREEGKLVQANDLKIYGGDFSMGFSTHPIDLSFATLTPQVGLIARIQNFERSNFVYIEGFDAVFGNVGTVNEFVQFYGGGGSFVFDMPLTELWTFAVDTEVYGLFYSNAKNDAFDVSIDGESGLFWDSSLTFYRKLKQPNQKIGARINSHLQWIEGGTLADEAKGRLVEWPENRLRSVNLEIFWQGLY